MVKLPEYEHETKIQPAPVSDALNATKGLTNAYGAIGQFGASIAQRSANEQARMAGEEAGQTPGRELFPAITEADAHYVQAYEQQSSQVLVTQADKLINDLYLKFKSVKNPSERDLSTLQESAEASIADLVELAPPSIRGNLKAKIEQKYNSAIYSASESVIKANQVRQQDIFDNYLIAENKNMLQYIATGQFDKANKSYEDIEMALDVNRQSIGEDEYAKARAILKASSDYATANYGRIEAYKEGGERAEANYIRTYSEKEQKGISIAERKSIVDGLIKAHAEDVKARRLSQDLSYSDAHTELLALDGNVPVERWREYQSKVSPQQFNSLQELYMRLQSDNLQANRLVNAISQDLNDPVAMTKYSDKEINTYFDMIVNKQAQAAAEKGIEIERPLLAQANIAASIPAKIPSYIDKLEKAVKYGGREQARDAAAAISALKVTNPAAIEGLDKEVAATANLFNTIRTDTPKEEWEAIEDARKSVFQLTPDVKEERMQYAQQIMSKNHGGKGSYNTSNAVLRKKLEGYMGGKRLLSKNVVIPDGMVNQFRTLLPSQLMITPNEEQAFQAVADQLKQTYDLTRTNNRDEFMRNAPERAAQKLDVGYFLNNSKAYALHKAIEENQMLNADPNAFVMDKLEWPNDPFKGKDIKDLDLIRQPYTKGNPKVLVNGIEQEIVIKSDVLTMQGKTLSWGFYGKKDILEVPINSSTAYGGIARWDIDEELFNSQLQGITEKDLANAIRLKTIADNEIGSELLDSDAYWILQMSGKNE